MLRTQISSNMVYNVQSRVSMSPAVSDTTVKLDSVSNITKNRILVTRPVLVNEIVSEK